MLKLSLYAAASLAGITSALPTENNVKARSVLRDAPFVRFDHETREVHAYSNLTNEGWLGKVDSDHPALKPRQQPGNLCSPILQKELEGDGGQPILPNWQKVDDMMKDIFNHPFDKLVNTGLQANRDYNDNNAGHKKENINVGDAGAWKCLTDPPMGAIQIKDKPQCINDTQIVQGTTEGTNGTFTATASFQDKTSATHTVSNAEEASIQYDFEFDVGIEGVFEAKNKISLGFKYTHTDEKATSEDVSNTVTGALNYAQKDGQECHAELTTLTCKAKGNNDITQEITGWVWYHFGDKLSWPDKSKVGFVDGNSDPNGLSGKIQGGPLEFEWDDKVNPLSISGQDVNGKHYSWAVQIEKQLSKDERTIKTPVDSAIDNISTDQNYKVKCGDGHEETKQAQLNGTDTGK